MKLCILVLGALLIAVPAHAVTFNDGGTHIIDADNSYPLDPVVVEDSPTGQPTTLIINEGGDVGSSSGDGLTANGASVVTLNGGVVEGNLTANGDTELTILSGAVNGRIYTLGSATLLVKGGTNLYLSAVAPGATVRIEGGEFRPMECNVYQNDDYGPNNLPCWGSSAMIYLADTDLVLTGGQFPMVPRPGAEQQNYISMNGESGGMISDTDISCTSLALTSIGTRADLLSSHILSAHLLSGSAMKMDEFSTAGYLAGAGDFEILGGTIRSEQCSSCRSRDLGSIGFYGCTSFPDRQPIPQGSVNIGGYGSVRMTHGEIELDLMLEGSAYGLITGGTIGRSVILRNSALTELGGGSLLGDSHRLYDDSTLKLSAGSISTSLFSLYDTSRLELIGSDFNYPLGFVEASSGTVSGTLSDGSPISVDFQKASGATVLLRSPAAPTTSNLSVYFSDIPSEVDTHGTVNGTFIVTNHGPDLASDLKISFEAPPEAVGPSMSEVWEQSGNTFTHTSIGGLGSGVSLGFEFSYSAGAQIETLENSVTVISDIFDPASIDPDETDNTATASINVACGATTIYGQNPASNSWVAFPDSCEVPSGWAVSQTRPEGFLPLGYDEGQAAGYDSGYEAGAVSADEALAAAQSAQATAEAEKDAALAAQATAESERDAALAAQTACSSDRTAALTAQAAAESARDAALAAQESAETARDAALAAQAIAESERDVALAAQAVAESERDAALAAQAASESERDVALAAQAVAEAERDLANASQATAESQRDSALLAQGAAEAARDAALAAQANVEAQREAALLAQDTAESDRNAALTALAAAEVQRDTALAAAASAEADRNVAAAALATALTERDAALTELLDTQLELDECRTEVTPEPSSAFLGFIVLAALGAVARGRRGKVGIS